MNHMYIYIFTFAFAEQHAEECAYIRYIENRKYIYIYIFIYLYKYICSGRFRSSVYVGVATTQRVI